MIYCNPSLLFPTFKVLCWFLKSRRICKQNKNIYVFFLPGYYFPLNNEEISLDLNLDSSPSSLEFIIFSLFHLENFRFTESIEALLVNDNH